MQHLELDGSQESRNVEGVYSTVLGKRTKAEHSGVENESKLTC